MATMRSTEMAQAVVELTRVAFGCLGFFCWFTSRVTFFLCKGIVEMV